MSAPTLPAELADIVGPDSVDHDPETIGRQLRDNSWLSPVLSEHITVLTQTGGAGLDVEALIRPADLDELARCVALAYRRDLPITMLGAGTSNFGQSIPLHGGVVIGLSRLDQYGPITGSEVVAQAGANLGQVDAAAREHGLELPVVTTTFASSSCAGWVAGGHVGLGSSAWGTIWDDLVAGATVMTVDAAPDLLTLDADQLEPVLHAYGTTGILTDVTFRLVPAHDWVELVACFDDFAAAAAFVVDVSARDPAAVRVVAAQEPAVTRAFTPMTGIVEPTESVVLAIAADDRFDDLEALADASGGRVVPWRGRGGDHRPTLAYMVYGHRMLWVKKVAPEGAFLHCYLDADRPLEQLAMVKETFGDRALVELKYIRSRWLRDRFDLSGDVVFAPLIGLVDGREGLPEMMELCDRIGVRYQNPHTFWLDDQGLFADPSVLRRFKASVDPKGLLNPGKLRPESPEGES